MFSPQERRDEAQESSKLPPASIGNPLYYAVFERARLAMTEAITQALSPDYKVADDLNVLFDPSEDKGIPPIGARFTEDNLVVIDPRKHEIVAGIRFYGVGMALLTSSDTGFDAKENLLVDALSKLEPLHDDLLDETFENGQLIFKSVQDQALGVEQLVASNPAIYATAEARQSGYSGIGFHYPSTISIEGSSIPLELAPYRKPGTFILQRGQGEAAAETQSFTLPGALEIDHSQLYYVEPIHPEWMKKLICCELDINGAERQLGSVSRKWNINLSQADISALANDMAGLPYPSRGGAFIRLESLLHQYPATTVDKRLLDESVAVEWEVWDAFGKAVGVDARDWPGMEMLKELQYDPKHRALFDRLEGAAEKRFWDRAQEIAEGK